MSRGAHGGRRAKRGHEEEHENHERWAVSYADMMTVLCALFIVLYSMSQVDQVKYEELAQSLAEGFHNESRSVLDGSAGVLADVTAGAPASAVAVPADAAAGAGEGAAGDLAAAMAEVNRLREIQAQIEGRLAAIGMGAQVRYTIDERGLIMGLVADDVYFDNGSAALQPAATTVLDAAAPVLVGITERISVEGHANVLPTSGRYATNWELSADRATQVLRHLVEADGLPAARISSTGFGDTRPLDPGPSPEALAANRRVDLVVHSLQPETVRGLIPSVVDGTAVPPPAPAPAPEPLAGSTPEPAAIPATGGEHEDEGH